jgi:S-adenosylmethionine:tRNA ribosyltransferase-isomerase
MPFKSEIFDYHLPSESINQNPYKDPNDSKLLIANKRDIITFESLPSIINKPSLFILNKSTVQNVRVKTNKLTGGSIEIFFLEILEDKIAKCLIKSSDKKHLNKQYNLNIFDFEIIDINNDTFHIKTSLNIEEILSKHGKTPLPPYIEDNENKYKYYNNQFSDGGFSVASPTAGLHFTNNLIKQLEKDGHEFVYINLDVNIDTFKPVTSEYLDQHNIHEEKYRILEIDFNKIMKAKELGIEIYCVGTTSLRTIETAYLTNNLAGKTDYFIFPDTKINIPDYLITNFHAPKSSLLSIVSAIYGNEWTELYKHALESGIKFLSFGDAVLFEVNE